MQFFPDQAGHFFSFSYSRKLNKAMLGILLGLLSCHSFADQDTRKSGEGGKQNLTEVVIVELEQAKRLYDLGAVFIDVRRDEEWRLGHIENARHVNFRKNFAQLKELEGVDKKTPLVFYCSMLECKAGPYASAVSIEWGYENVFYFQSGYFAWMAEDYPIDMSNQLRTFAGDSILIRKAN